MIFTRAPEPLCGALLSGGGQLVPLVIWRTQRRTATGYNPMARRHKLWAKATRARMILSLGGACAACRTTSSLEFDCIVPMGHDHHAGSAPERICFYRKQMLAGNIQILCSECNALKSDLDMDTWLAMVSRLRQWESSLSLPPASGRGPRLTPEERVEYLRDLRAIFPSR